MPAGFDSYDQWKTASPYDEERPILLALPCNGDRIDESTVTLENIEEDIQGRDLVTFQCPVCGKQHQSYRLG